MYKVYVLLDENRVVMYVGCSVSPERRIRQHMKDKFLFKKFVILKEYKRKREALIAENAIIRFIESTGGLIYNSPIFGFNYIWEE